ncbi:hypothetical protein TNCV_697541 [Trichonephila clavipes]|nr:hypothetical protein TNCV_697541 [Trichonephila clavipes]
MGPHTNTIVIAAQIKSRFIAEDDLVPFHCHAIPSCVTLLQTEATVGGCHWQRRNGNRNTRCPSARCLAMVQENTGGHSEGAACVWTAQIRQLALRMHVV